jgi:hypothetical protein
MVRGILMNYERKKYLSNNAGCSSPEEVCRNLSSLKIEQAIAVEKIGILQNDVVAKEADLLETQNLLTKKITELEQRHNVIVQLELSVKRLERSNSMLERETKFLRQQLVSMIYFCNIEIVRHGRSDAFIESG